MYFVWLIFFKNVYIFCFVGIFFIGVKFLDILGFIMLSIFVFGLIFLGNNEKIYNK